MVLLLQCKVVTLLARIDVDVDTGQTVSVVWPLRSARPCSEPLAIGVGMTGGSRTGTGFSPGVGSMISGAGTSGLGGWAGGVGVGSGAGPGGAGTSRCIQAPSLSRNVNDVIARFAFNAIG